MDAVFRAIDDPSRRLLLDKLYERDGQTLGELCGYLPGMTRFGVMSHLAVLEEADLVIPLRQGRYKHHYLNPIPIRLIHERWISRYAERTVTALTRLKAGVETGGTPMDAPVHVYKILIRGTAEDVWDAIVQPDKSVEYFYGTRVQSDWEVGSELTYAYPDGTLASDGRIISVDRPKRLEFTFRALWDEDLRAAGPVREVWTLDETDGMVALAVELYDVAPDSKLVTEFSGGLVYILSGLKTLVETGRPMVPMG
jgi:uncharacterized protein YndB with AHSA1/START domain/DNA-binding transcriptional ArsR family regulator